ncbi:hypothetical protein C8J56DRAFT_897260 [Mycena floridula]|nr:hypothetical protein C8J56DRAFT_897260 [Mycena floridula]
MGLSNLFQIHNAEDGRVLFKNVLKRDSTKLDMGYRLIAFSWDSQQQPDNMSVFSFSTLHRLRTLSINLSGVIESQHLRVALKSLPGGADIRELTMAVREDVSQPDFVAQDILRVSGSGLEYLDLELYHAYDMSTISRAVGHNVSHVMPAGWFSIKALLEKRLQSPEVFAYLTFQPDRCAFAHLYKAQREQVVKEFQLLFSGYASMITITNASSSR